MEQIVDKRTVGIPPDIVVARNEVEDMRDETRAFRNGAKESMEKAAASADVAAAQATDAHQSAMEAANWATLHNQGISFSQDEPAIKWDGMTWIQTNDADSTIVAFKRWQQDDRGHGIVPSASLLPSKTMRPRNRGAWREFKVAQSAIS